MADEIPEAGQLKYDFAELSEVLEPDQRVALAQAYAVIPETHWLKQRTAVLHAYNMGGARESAYLLYEHAFSVAEDRVTLGGIVTHLPSLLSSWHDLDLQLPPPQTAENVKAELQNLMASDYTKYSQLYRILEVLTFTRSRIGIPDSMNYSRMLRQHPDFKAPLIDEAMNALALFLNNINSLEAEFTNAEFLQLLSIDAATKPSVQEVVMEAYRIIGKFLFAGSSGSIKTPDEEGFAEGMRLLAAFRLQPQLQFLFPLN